jgi:hypothetical protein
VLGELAISPESTTGWPVNLGCTNMVGNSIFHPVSARHDKGDYILHAGSDMLSLLTLDMVTALSRKSPLILHLLALCQVQSTWNPAMTGLENAP